MLDIYHLNEAVAILAMKRGLCPSSFTYSLDKAYPKFYSKLLTCAQKYIRLKEVALSQQEAKERPKKKQARGGPSGSQPKKLNSSRRQSLRPKNLTNKFDNYTLLIAPGIKIIMEIEEKYL